MLYLILEKKDLEYLNSLSDHIFDIIETDLMPPEYVLVHSKKDYLDVFTILERTKCRGLALEPYISKDTFNNIYPLNIQKKMVIQEKDVSFFDLLITNHTNQIPKYNKEYYFLPAIQPSINTMKYSLDLKRLNELLEINFLKISHDEIKFTLREIFNNVLKSIIKAEANEEVLDYKETEFYNNNFYILVISEFVIEATYLYPKKEIEEFLIHEFNLKKGL